MTSDSLFLPAACPPAVLEQLSSTAWLRAVLDFEVALARVQSDLGVIASESATEIADTCDGLERELNSEAIARAAGEAGTPVEPILGEVRRRLSARAAADLHRSATSQDAMDSAAMLVAARVLPLVLSHTEASATACAELAERHRHTLIPARTLLQQALPTTFGLKSAGWLTLLLDARLCLEGAARTDLAAQFGGAAGTLAAAAPHGVEVAARVARELGLVEPSMPWHVNRIRVVSLANALNLIAGAGAKVATDLILMAQTEVAELREARTPGRGGSTSLPHKQNPIHAVQVRAAAARAHGLAGILAGGLGVEHERAAGHWQAEWQTLNDLLAATASTAWHLFIALSGLEIDTARMASNLELTQDLLMAEPVAVAVINASGLHDSRAAVSAACADATQRRVSLSDALARQEGVAGVLTQTEIDHALDAHNYLGASKQLIDAAIRRYQEETG